jgi:hypothetical protein
MATVLEVQARFVKDMAALPPDQRSWLHPYIVLARQGEVIDTPGEPVVVVAEVGHQVIYWSDFEEGWEAVEPTDEGKIPTRGSNQFTLAQLIVRLCEKRC